MATAVKDKPAGKELEAKVTQGGALALSEIDQAMQADAGQGISTDASDNMVPQISILQPQSPEVLDGPTKVEGAAPGCFMLGSHKIIKGSEGFWFQPCHFDQIWLEFQPLDKGGGFVAAHSFRGVNGSGIAIPPDGAKSKDKNRWTLGDNEVIHYRQAAGIAWIDGVGLEYVIPFKSTGHTVAKEWMTAAGRANRFPNGQQRPLYGHVYKLTLELRTNASGRWYQIRIGDPVLLGSSPAEQVVGDSLKAYAMGKALCNAFESNVKQADMSAERDAPAPSGKDLKDDIPF